MSQEDIFFSLALFLCKKKKSFSALCFLGFHAQCVFYGYFQCSIICKESCGKRFDSAHVEKKKLAEEVVFNFFRK
jgi:hypothetical protein